MLGVKRRHEARSSYVERGDASLYQRATGRLLEKMASSSMPQGDDEHVATLAMIAAAQSNNPRRLLEAIAEVARQLETKGYTTAEIEGAVAELLEEVEQSFSPRH